MMPLHMQKMSKRDKARLKFVREHRRNRMINTSVKNKIIFEREKIRDVEEGIT